MGSLKSIALAGVATLALCASATAADLFPPPPMPMAAPVDFAGGWYLRGDVGVGTLDLKKFEGVDGPGFGPTPPGYYQAEQASLGDQAFAGAGVGYQFNSWLRFDATAEYRTAASLKFAESYPGGFFYFDANGNAVPGRSLDFYSGHLSSIVALANAYIDLGKWHGVTPFIGAGVGAAFHKVAGLTDFGAGSGPNGAGGIGGAAGGAGVFADKYSTSLAWAVHAGLGYSITPNLKLELAYRYLNMGKASSGQLGCFNQSPCPGTTFTFKNIDSHDIKLGMRWMLGAPVAVAAAPIMPEPAPIIRKY